MVLLHVCASGFVEQHIESVLTNIVVRIDRDMGFYADDPSSSV